MPEPPPALPRFPKPETVRGIYLTAWSAGSTKKMEKMLGLLERTELNAVVIDVRDSGMNYWKTGIALSETSGADTIAITNPEPLFEKLEAAKVYPIARLACFRDNKVPPKHPERAVQTADGQVWKDRAGNTWLDPYNKENWEYLGEIVDFALEAGFPEIQLDYVRFPSEGKMSTMHFPSKELYGDSDSEPAQVIRAFAAFIKRRVEAKQGVLSADLFGIISSGDSDQGIGQRLSAVYDSFDLICPMVYPSHYAKGEYGIANPDASPYAILMKSLADYKRKFPEMKVRPWLQDFSLGTPYGKAEVQAQIRALYESGYTEYLLWNPKNNYTEAAVVDTSGLVPAKAPASSSTAPSVPGG